MTTGKKAAKTALEGVNGVGHGISVGVKRGGIMAKKRALCPSSAAMGRQEGHFETPVLIIGDVNHGGRGTMKKLGLALSQDVAGGLFSQPL